MTRRAFLRLGLAAASGAVLAACKRSSGGAPPATSGLSVFPGGAEFLADTPQRFTFGLAGEDGRMPAVPAEGVTVSVVGGDGETHETHALLRRFRSTAPGEPGAYLACRLPPLAAGFADVQVVLPQDAGEPLRGTTTIEVRQEPRVPVVGSAAPSLATPTEGNLRGAEQLCTREGPCGLHERSLHEVLDAGQPFLLAVGSPLLCESRTCGPVLDEVLAVRGRFPGIGFLHVEPYAELNTVSLAPIMRRWNLPSEPWVFLVGDDGRVAARFEGPVVAAELRPVLEALVG